MKLKNSLYPYPVLAQDRDDYNNTSYFRSEIHGRIEFNSLVISAKFKLQDDGLLKLIKNGSAAFALHIECSKTAYRNRFYTNNFDYEVRINLNDIQGDIEVLGIVIALKAIESYNNLNLNNDYKDLNIRIEKANILAESGQTLLQLEDNFGGVEQESLFKVQKVKNDKAWIDLNFSQDEYVLICINENEYKTYMSLAKGTFKNTILSLVMLPVTIAVLNIMEKYGEEHEGKKWYKAIVGKLESNGIDLDNLNQAGEKSSLVIAQKIFQNPIKKAFEEINNQSDDSE